jgi:hypothetical protein
LVLLLQSAVATRVLTVDDPSNAAIVVAHNGATALNLYADADEANIGSYLQGANMKFFTTPSGGSQQNACASPMLAIQKCRLLELM